MKRLSNQDWSLIARYIAGEASPEDLVQLQALYKQQEGLQSTIHQIQKDLSTSSSLPTETDFDAGAAFLKLHERIQNENLL